MPNDHVKISEMDSSLSESLRKSLSCAVIVVDEQKKICLITSDAAEFLGVKTENILQKQIDVLPSALQEIFRKTMASGQPVTSEIHLPHPARSERTVHVHSSPTPGWGKIFGVVMVLTDFTTLEKLEKKLTPEQERMNRLASIGSLSSSMAHEIKNAMVAVKTFMDLLLAQNAQDELATMVSLEMTRIDSIVSQILKFAGPAKLPLSPVHLHEILNQSIQLVQTELEKKNITLRCSFGASPDVVKGDDYQLKQAFLNLLFNAVEATPANGTLTITTEFSEAASESPNLLRETIPSHLQVRIRDSGIGIAQENLEKVFDPFFTTKPKATGLGLPITRRIIQEHRGEITMDSQPENGAEVSVVFPLPR